jgi:hypothetical protein
MKISFKKIIKYLIFENHFKKIKNDDLKNSKHSKYLYPIRFSYKKINEDDKLKFEHYLMYFLS